ncbi:sensor histidine kinase [Enterocloster bolteae]|jgi:two-component system sensor histidine kinase YesM|uniref:sensor histidine kinase n=1 Tax=Enterocloster bolteae TaxID=208479 RepID=UPI002A8054B9|nr:histidine kinase [Enterocloster bolteae]
MKSGTNWGYDEQGAIWEETVKRPFVFSNFQKKILQSYLIIIVGGLVLFYTLVAVMVRESSLKTAERNQISMCIKVSQQLESFMVEMRNVGFQVMMNSRLIQDFGTFSDDKANDNYYGDHIVDHINAVSALADINGIQRIATRISVFNRYGDYVSSGVMPQSKAYADNVLRSHMDLDEIISRLVLNDGHIYVEGPHPDYWNSKVGYEMISLYCPLGNKIQDDMYGIIEIQQDFQKLVKTLLPGLDQDMAVLLFDSLGRCIFNSMESICPPEYYDFYYSQASKNPDSRYGFCRIKVGNRAQEQYLSAGISETSGWMAVMVRNKSSIVNVIQDIQKVIIMAIFVFMVLSAYMAYRISLKMTRPINDMIVSAQSISWSNLDMKTLEGNDENEIMALNNTFKETLKRLSKSMQLELGARLNALQSQMNPHFLYNTLSVISASADQQEKVERMCSRLSDMLRYSTVYEEESNSTLEDEVRHTENYLELMKDRYEENLIYNIEEAGELERVKVPRVILQPIVENCFKHGFGQNGFPWIIHVAVTASHGHWRIHVRNNGRPFQERDLTELNEKVEGFLKGEQKKISGIGLTNTIIRLRLLYEEQVEYEIYTGNDGYTYVVLKGNYK